MKRDKHKRKTKHILLVASDSVQSDVRQYFYKPGFLWTLILILCVVLSILAAYFFAERGLWDTVNVRNEEQIQKIKQLEEEKTSLEEKLEAVIAEKEQESNSLNSQIEELNQQIKLLSDTVNEKVQSETALRELIESQSVPTLFPLTGSASMEEGTENNNPLVIFQATAGSTVVATASGTVTAVSEDTAYGHSITVDHGNGYVTIYRNGGNTNLKIGDSVVQGTTLYLIAKDNTKVCYQMMKDGVYINPVTMIAIDG